ncbi:hypothetical protein QL285_019420 [Trifolium repens]|nr:hypothetical protein QL285_019420 [Trifolium repens]
MLGFQECFTTVIQLANTRRIRLLLFLHKKYGLQQTGEWSLADRRMVSQILATSYILIQKLFPHMGYCFAMDISSETTHYSWQKEYL